VVTTSGADTDYASSRLHGPAILDLLAGVNPLSADSLADGLRMIRTREPLVILTTDLCPDEDLAAAFRIVGPGVTTAVVFERRTYDTDAQSAHSAGLRAGVVAGSRGGAGVGPRGRYIRVPAGGSFRAAWEGA
jgi:hypothetical protein